MTRKDYEKFAAIFRQIDMDPETDTDMYDRGHTEAMHYFAGSLCSIFAADNPRFDRSRFLKACGIEE